MIILSIFFFCYSIPSIKRIMFNESPEPFKVKLEIIEELKRIKGNNKYGVLNPGKKKIKTVSLFVKNSYGKKNPTKLLTRNNQLNTISQKFRINTAIKTDYNSFKNLLNVVKKEENMESNQKEDLNDLPYSIAIIKDKRNIFEIFCSLIIQKMELLNLFFGTLLYSDDVISNKYHNNGELDFFSTLSLSLLANIITSIICYFIKYSKGIEERYDLIKELKSKKFYLRNVVIFIKFLKIKFIFFFTGEIILILCSFYYIVIFCIVYSKSKSSLIFNYINSLIEAAITSIAITIIIVVTRKLGIYFSNRRLYNISKFINQKF